MPPSTNPAVSRPQAAIAAVAAAVAAATAAAVMTAAVTAAVLMVVVMVVPPCVSSRLRPVLVSMSRAEVGGRAFEALAAHQIDHEEEVGGRKEPPAEFLEPRRSAGGCEQLGWTIPSPKSPFPMQIMLA